VLEDLGIWPQTLAWVKDSMVLGHSELARAWLLKELGESGEIDAP
jgi:hypothetical protein